MSDQQVGTTGKVIDHRGVDHPLHYNNHPSGVEVIEVIRYMTFNSGSAFKYVLRRGDKIDPALGPVGSVLKDLDKSLWYLNDELQYMPGRTCTVPLAVEQKVTRMISHEPMYEVKTFMAYALGYMRYGYAASLQGMSAAVNDLKREYV